MYPLSYQFISKIGATKMIQKLKKTSNRVETWEKFYRLNRYYHSYIQKLTLHIIPKDASIIEFNCKCGELLSRLPNKDKTGVEFSEDFNSCARKRGNGLKVVFADEVFEKAWKKEFDYILLSHTLSNLQDVQEFIKNLKKISHDETRVVVFYFNYLWKPFLDLAQKLGLKLPDENEPNWLSGDDIKNFFYLESFKEIKNDKRFVFPYRIPVISDFINKYLSALPIINSFCLINYSVYRLQPKRKDFSVSIIIPARNEAGNMKGIFNKIPQLGKSMEVIFVEGHSKDNTYQVIKEEIRNYKGPIKARLYKQPGKGKGDAVRFGFSKAKKELFAILDADLTVDPEELPKFYEALAERKGELVMGSRLVYPMKQLAMRTLNVFGNKFFSTIFTFLLGQKIKDTLCGTKVLLKQSYQKIEKNRKVFGNFDPFGDFDLIFGAAKLNLEILEIPIRYKERTYGNTNISRFRHGFLLLRMCLIAARKLRFI